MHLTMIVFRPLLLLLFFLSGSVFADSTIGAVCNTTSNTKSYYELQSNQLAPIDTYLQTRLHGFFVNQSLLTSLSGHREKKIVYFDTPDLKLFNLNIELSHTLEKQLPKYIREREYITYKNHNQAETIKFQARKYKTKLSQYDKLPLIRYVRRKERPLLLERLSNFPDLFTELSETLEVNHTEKAYLITHMGKVISQVSLDKYHIDNFGLPVYGYLLSLELSSDYKTRLNTDEIATLTTTLCTLESEIVNSLSLTFKPEALNYSHYTQLAKDKLPIRDFILRNPLLFNILQSIFFIILGTLLLTLLIGRYKNSHSTKKIITRSRD